MPILSQILLSTLLAMADKPLAWAIEGRAPKVCLDVSRMWWDLPSKVTLPFGIVESMIETWGDNIDEDEESSGRNPFVIALKDTDCPWSGDKSSFSGSDTCTGPG